MDHSEKITISGVPSGKYTLTVNGNKLDEFQANDGCLNISFEVKESQNTFEIMITKND